MGNWIGLIIRWISFSYWSFVWVPGCQGAGLCL